MQPKKSMKFFFFLYRHIYLLLFMNRNEFFEKSMPVIILENFLMSSHKCLHYSLTCWITIIFSWESQCDTNCRLRWNGHIWWLLWFTEIHHQVAMPCSQWLKVDAFGVVITDYSNNNETYVLSISLNWKRNNVPHLDNIWSNFSYI